MYFNTLLPNQLSICIHACGLLVVTIIVTKRSCIPVAQVNGLSGMTDQHSYAHSHYGSNEISITLNNTVVLLNINYKTQYGRIILL